MDFTVTTLLVIINLTNLTLIAHATRVDVTSILLLSMLIDYLLSLGPIYLYLIAKVSKMIKANGNLRVLSSLRLSILQPRLYTMKFTRNHRIYTLASMDT